MNSQINISNIFMGYIETLHTLSKTGTVFRYIVILIESSAAISSEKKSFFSKDSDHVGHHVVFKSNFTPDVQQVRWDMYDLEMCCTIATRTEVGGEISVSSAVNFVC
jgi:hypothetical protein